MYRTDGPKYRVQGAVVGETAKAKPLVRVLAKKVRVPRSLLPAGSSRLYWSYQETYRETCHQEVGVTTQVQLTTADELLRHPGDGYRYELIEGELKRMAPAGNEHGMLALRLAAKLWNFVDAKGLGILIN